MALQVLLMTSLATLVSVEIRSAGSKNKLDQARQNALLAVAVALGELQKHVGPDMRVTASAAILDSTPESIAIDDVQHPHWTGVWEKDTHTGQPSLRTWLVSGNESRAPGQDDFLNARDANLRPGDAIPLVSSGTLGQLSQENQYVYAKKISSGNGSYAYWISDEQSKAQINLGDDTSGNNTAANLLLPTTYNFSQLSSILPSDLDAYPNVTKSSSIDELSIALGIDDVSKQDLQSHYHDISFDSYGLLTNAANGGFKVDMTALFELENLPEEYDQKSVYDAPEAIQSDPWATQAPSWNYMKSFYELRDDLLEDGMLTPRTGDENTHAISPVIASFKYGISGGLNAENRLIVNLYPQVVLYNPYNATLQGRDYGFMFFANPYLQDENVHGELEAWRFLPMMRANYNADLYPDSDNYEIGRTFTFNSDIATKTDQEVAGDPPIITPTGGPRFTIKCPDIPPGQAIVFTPDARKNFQRVTASNSSLTPGFKPHAFVWHLNRYLINPGDTVRWSVIDAGRTDTVYLDAALVDDLSVEGLLSNSGAPNRLKYINRGIESGISDRVFQMTGRIPIQQSNLSTTGEQQLYYGIPNPSPQEQVAWGAYGLLAHDPDMNGDRPNNIRPYANFNMRASIMDSKNILDENGFSHSFYRPYAGGNLPVIDFFGDNNEKVYLGGSYSAGSGSESLILYDVPHDETIFHSLAQFQHIKISDHFDEPSYAIGNSWASPHIARDALYARGDGVISRSGDYIGDIDHSVVDTSYLLNQALWDGYFFSTLKIIDTEGEIPTSHQPQNPHYKLLENLPEEETFDDPSRNAAMLYVNGAFNVNSVSIDAWKAVLAGMDGIVLPELSNTPISNPHFRFYNPREASDNLWSGFRELTDEEIDQLASEIVEQVKSRGPFTSLGDFVNRSLVNDTASKASDGLSGALQTAIDHTSINEAIPGNDVTSANTLDFAHSSHITGSTSDSISSYLTQADILTSIGSIITVRSDTFVVRAYGETKDSFSGQTTAQAWCEVVVQRIPEYINPTDNSPADKPERLSDENTRFGRQMKVISFRWLSPNEV